MRADIELWHIHTHHKTFIYTQNKWVLTQHILNSCIEKENLYTVHNETWYNTMVNPILYLNWICWGEQMTLVYLKNICIHVHMSNQSQQTICKNNPSLYQQMNAEGRSAICYVHTIEYYSLFKNKPYCVSQAWWYMLVCNPRTQLAQVRGSQA